MGIEGQQQCGAFLDEANPSMAAAVNAALVAFGLAKPALEVQVVLWEVLRRPLPQTNLAQNSPSRGLCVAASDDHCPGIAPAGSETARDVGRQSPSRDQAWPGRPSRLPPLGG